MTKNFFGAELLSKAQGMINDQVAQATAQGQTIPQEQVTAALEQAKTQVAPFLSPGLAVAHLALGFLVMALVTSLGGPTGPGLNPARDLWTTSSSRSTSKIKSLVNTRVIQNGGMLGYQ